jgi:hypothetical protein
MIGENLPMLPPDVPLETVSVLKALVKASRGPLINVAAYLTELDHHDQ